MNRGWKKLNPTDMRGVLVPGRRLTGRAWRQGRFAKRRHWGSGERRGESGRGGEVDPRLRMVERPGPRPSLSEAMAPRPGERRVGEWLGWLAFGILVVLWLCVVVAVVERIGFGGGGFAARVLVPVFWVSVVGVHLFGLASEGLLQGRGCWGMRAVMGLWLSLFSVLPLGGLLWLLQMLF